MRGGVVAGCMLASVGTIGIASAADIYPAPPPPAAAPVYRPVYNWSGFYLGGDVGYGWASSTSTTTLSNPLAGVFTNSGSGNASGAVAGGQLGANWQAGMFVFGVEGDFQWSGQKDTKSVSCGLGCTLTGTGKIDAFGTARLRAGAAFDRLFVYATGGGAWTHLSDSLDLSALGTTVNILSVSSGQFGWTVGGGLEFAFAENWTGKVEYLYIDTSNVSLTGSLPALIRGGTVSRAENVKDSILRFGLNYKFTPGGPVVARY
jgi:outer membrane immunogenic protein